MENGKIAVPSIAPGGLEAQISPHFGHCELYTIIEVVDNKISEISTIPNIPHQEGGCMAPVNYLHQNGVNVLIAGGMGMRPLLGFQEVGIDVFYGAQFPTVGAVVETFLQNGLQKFSTEYTCGGGHHH